MKKISKMKSSKFGGSSTLPTTNSNGGGGMNMKGGIKSGGGGLSGSSGTVSSSSSTTNNPTNNNSQDESHLKLLRDLSHLIEENRHCFDCGQRGPTYVNVTIGSFVCMTCSGLLRGLTPPHRVKSISMASFSPDEMELLKTHGNEYCRKVWLSTYTSKDSLLSTQNDPDRMNALKSHLSAKYEQKRYYVDPSRLPKSELMGIQSKNMKLLSGNNAPATNGLIQINGHHHNKTSNGTQKSPSLSASQHQHSPQLLNNLRMTDSSNNTFSTLHEKGRPSVGAGIRLGGLSSSATLPDIKPLSSLLDSNFSSTTNSNSNPVIVNSNSLSADLSTLSLSSNGSSSSGITMNNHNNPVPINFINNNLNSAKVLNMNSISTPSPWGNVNGNGSSAGTDGTTTMNNNDANFNANFADFEDAFKNSDAPPTNGGNTNTMNGFITNNLNGHGHGGSTILSPKLMNGGFQPFQSSQSQPPASDNSSSSVGTGGNNNNDKYAALKDLDSLFKQQSNGDVFGSSPSGLSNSMSVPAKLSSSCGDQNNGWFAGGSSNTSPHNPNQQPPPQQNPFSQAGTNNGWSNGSTSNHTGFMNMNTNVTTNPHNPFYANGFGSPSTGAINMVNGNHSLFSSAGGFPPNSTTTTSQPNNPPWMMNGQGASVVNPFSVPTGGGFLKTTPSTTTNPNNPFL